MQRDICKQGESFQLHILSWPREDSNWLVSREDIPIFSLFLLLFQKVGRYSNEINTKSSLNRKLKYSGNLRTERIRNN